MVVLGAGASWPLPVTSALTKNLVDNYQFQPSNPSSLLGFNVFNLLQSAGFTNVEAMMGEIWNTFDRIKSGSIPNWLRPYATSPDVGEMLFDSFLDGAIWSLNLLHQCESSYDGRPAIATILDTVLGSGRTLVATLNYDDFVLQTASPMFDGFDRSGTRSTFTTSFTRAAQQHEHGLLWLHGSGHFNLQYPMGTGVAVPPDEVYWEDDVSTNLRQLRGHTFGGDIELPIVIGIDKPRQLLRPPYVDYWSVLWESIRYVDNLVVIGYSGADQHLNRVLMNLVLRRGSNLKVVVCEYSATWANLAPMLGNVFRTLPMLPARPGPVRGTSLQKVIDKCPNTRPAVWADIDGVEDLAQHVDLLSSVLTTK